MFSILTLLAFAISYAFQWGIRFSTPGSKREKTLTQLRAPIVGLLFVLAVLLSARGVIDLLPRTLPLILFAATPAILYMLLAVLWAVKQRAQAKLTARSRRGRQTKEQVRGLGRALQEYPGAFTYWVRLAFAGDTVRWSAVHTVLLAAAMFAAANLSWVGLLAGYILVSISVSRAFTVHRTRQKQIDRLFEFVQEKGLAKKDATAASTIQIIWELDGSTPKEIRIGYHVGFKVHDSKILADFEQAFDGQFWTQESYKFFWDKQNNCVVISNIVLPSDLRWGGKVHEDPFTFILGKNLRTGEDVTFSVKSENPHMLDCGGTGSGKSEVMLSIIGQAMLKNWYIAIADPKASGLVQLSRHRRYSNRNGLNTGVQPLHQGDARPGIIVHATDITGCGDVLDLALAEMEYRKQLTVQYNVSNVGSLPEEVRNGANGEPPIRPMLIVVDEVVSFFMKNEGDTDDPVLENINAARKAGKAALLRLSMESRAYEMFLLVAGQQPSAADLGSNFRAQLGLRVGMGGLNSGTSLMAFNESTPPPLQTLNKRTGKKIPGRGRYKLDMSLPTETFQAYWCGPEAADLDQFCPIPDSHQNALVMMPRSFSGATAPASTTETGTGTKNPARAVPIINSETPMASLSEPTGWEGTEPLPEPENIDWDNELANLALITEEPEENPKEPGGDWV